MICRDELYSKIKTLNERVWAGRVKLPHILRWLARFDDGPDPERDQQIALYLLSRFMYFGDVEVRQLLRVLYRDHYKYPIVADIRHRNGDTLDSGFIQTRFHDELQATRFLGMGNPAESGTHLLYYFRQENELPTHLFINTHEVLRSPGVRRYVFIDDFCGSGNQAIRYSRELVEIKKQDARRTSLPVYVSYFVLFGTRKGLEHVRAQTEFDEVRCAVELDNSYRCFAEESRYFAGDDMAKDKDSAEEVCRRYGRRLQPDAALGYDDGQLLLGLFHNTPNNTLPVIWSDNGWEPIFRRYPKYEGSIKW